MGAIKQMMITQGYFDTDGYYPMEEPREYNNRVLAVDGQLLSDMRDKGMSEIDARFLIESYNMEPFNDTEWLEVQYHADMQDIHKAEKYDYAGNE